VRFLPWAKRAKQVSVVVRTYSHPSRSQQATLMFKSASFKQHLKETAQIAEAKKRGKLYDQLHNLIKEHGMADVEWMMGVIKEDIVSS
jgi:hypothetical protein